MEMNDNTISASAVATPAPAHGSEADKAMQLGRQVGDARLSRGWTREQLADKIGVSSSYIFKLERGKVKAPRGQILANIAQALSLSIDALRSLAGSSEDLDLDTQIKQLEEELKERNINLIGRLSQLRPSKAGKRFYVRFLGLLLDVVKNQNY